MLTFHLKWEYNLQVRHGARARLPVRIIHIPARVVVVVAVVDKRAHGVAVVNNGVDEDQGRVPVRTQAGTRRVLVGIRVVVRGVVRPTGIFELCRS